MAMPDQMGGVFVASALACLLVGNVAIRGLVSMRWIQPTRYEDCPPLQRYQQAKQGTPTMGGIFVLAIGAAVAAVFGGLSQFSGWVVLGTVGGLGLLGMADDLLKLQHPNARGLRFLPKLVVALALGGLVGWVVAEPHMGYQQLQLPGMAQEVTIGWLSIPMAMFVVAGCAHAVNLTDGMDGLAVGCLAIAFLTLGLWTLTDPAQRIVAIWCLSFAGACVGFLWFNSFPASVFLGDVGALGLGGALGVLALLGHFAMGLFVLGGVFVAEAVSVMLQVASYRWRNKRRIFRVAPLHHHFQLGGMSEHKLVVRFWITGLLLAALSLTAFSVHPVPQEVPPVRPALSMKGWDQAGPVPTRWNGAGRNGGVSRRVVQDATPPMAGWYGVHHG